MNEELKKKKDRNTQRVTDDEVKDCTFKPKTNEAHNREVIKMLLKG